MAKNRDDDYPVGFGKPPKHTQFKKGQSGNPMGRPRGSKDFSTLIYNELGERVSAKENGRTKSMTKREVMAKQLVNKGVKGDLPATKVLLPYMERREEANRQGSAQLETPRAQMSDHEVITLFEEAVKYLALPRIKIPSDDDDSSAKS
jgi:Family of unknown function (DUF5681)